MPRQNAELKDDPVRAAIDKLSSPKSAGPKFFRALYTKHGAEAVTDLMDRLRPKLEKGEPINPKRDFTEEEHKIYKSTWPQMFSRRHVLGGAATIAGLVPLGLAAGEGVLHLSGAHKERGERARRAQSRRQSQVFHDNVHDIGIPVMGISGLAISAIGQEYFDGAKLEEVSRAITQMALLEQRDSEIER